MSALTTLSQLMAQAESIAFAESIALAASKALVAERDAEIVRLKLQVAELQGAAGNSRGSLRLTRMFIRERLTKVLGAFNKATAQFLKAARAAGVSGPSSVTDIGSGDL